MTDVFMITFSLSFILFIIGLFTPSVTLFWSKKDKTRANSAKLYLLTAFLSLCIFGALNDSKKKNTQLIAKKDKKVEVNSSINPDDRIQFDKNGNQVEKLSIKKEYSYKLIESHDKHPRLENLAIELHCQDISKENLELIAREIKSKICTKDCNIELYDDRKYYEMDRRIGNEENACTDRFGMIGGSQYKDCLETVTKKYYVKVADHLLGFLGFDEVFNYFPRRDWQYKELGGKL